MPLDVQPGTEVRICGGLCLLPGQGLVPADLTCVGDTVVRIDRQAAPSGTKSIDAQGCLVLPGIVDIHGDAFERQIMPRPKTMFPLEIAVLETDRQLVANGITTAYHGITVSWEPGLRSLEQAMKIVNAIDDAEASLHADNRIHIRWETYAIDQVPAVVELFSRPKRPLLAFNDHTTPSLAGIRKDVKIRGSAERAMVELDAYRELLLGISSFSPAVPEAINAVASAAASQGVVMLSHDDCTIAMRQGYRRKGASVAEFPMNWETLDEAGAAGDSIVLGSPNVVRGGSHNGAISAEEAIARQLCNILASDYYYPAPLQAALALVSRGRLPLEAAWNLISRTPAEACALTDRGIIAEGMRADLVVIPQHGRRPKATIAGGRLVYSHH